jgi:hypothetical protein
MNTRKYLENISSFEIPCSIFDIRFSLLTLPKAPHPLYLATICLNVPKPDDVADDYILIILGNHVEMTGNANRIPKVSKSISINQRQPRIIVSSGTSGTTAFVT